MCEGVIPSAPEKFKVLPPRVNIGPHRLQFLIHYDLRVKHITEAAVMTVRGHDQASV